MTAADTPLGTDEQWTRILANQARQKAEREAERARRTINTGVTSSRKRVRKPRAATERFHEAIVTIVAEYNRLSVRQLFYQLVARGEIAKTEKEYGRVSEASVQLRLGGAVPYRKFADDSRTRKEIYTSKGLGDALESAHGHYRRNYWLDQPAHVEVWCEKAALSGVINPVCSRYGVPYVATRGFASLTLRYETGQAFKESGKQAVVLYFGDHDASGQTMSANLETELRLFYPDVRVVRVALNPDQIADLRLPTRPGKRTDTRHAAFSAEFGDASVELDAMPPNLLEALVDDAIAGQIDRDAWARLQLIEEKERQSLADLAAMYQ